jgi:ribosomal protein S21
MNTVKVSLTNTEERTYKEGGFESLLRRFNRSVQDYGVLGELRKREFYESPSTVVIEKLTKAELSIFKKARTTTGEEDDV